MGFMGLPPPLRYRVDAADVIVAVGEGFEAFAAANGAPGLERAALGTSLWAHVQGFEVKAIYRDLLTTCRRTPDALEFPYRCDAPTTRRFMHMRIAGLGNGAIGFESRTLRVEPRARAEWPPPPSRPGDDLLTVCAWCRKVQVGRWVELEEAIRRLDLFGARPMPTITHGICPPCAAAVRAESGLPWRRGA